MSEVSYLQTELHRTAGEYSPLPIPLLRWSQSYLSSAVRRVCSTMRLTRGGSAVRASTWDRIER